MVFFEWIYNMHMSDMSSSKKPLKVILLCCKWGFQNFIVLYSQGCHHISHLEFSDFSRFSLMKFRILHDLTVIIKFKISWDSVKQSEYNVFPDYLIRKLLVCSLSTVLNTYLHVSNIPGSFSSVSQQRMIIQTWNYRSR